jgi:hypothetical protein
MRAASWPASLPTVSSVASCSCVLPSQVSTVVAVRVGHPCVRGLLLIMLTMPVCVLPFPGVWPRCCARVACTPVPRQHSWLCLECLCDLGAG